jgi:phage recombination protein Bet
MSESDTQLIVPTDDRTKIEIIPFGTDEKIQLNVAIVQRIIAVPTKSGKQPDSAQCIKFMMLCKARHLNPFEGDAYLLGYDTQNGPQFSLITAHQVFLKRAEASQGFAGMQSGVIVEKDGALIEREGDLTLTGEKLLGGWAKVFRSNIEHPFYRRLKLETFSTGRSRWEKDPAGMIVKCAEADALRSAFPTHLGGLYVEEERPPIDISATTIPRAQIGPAATANNAPAAEEPTPRAKKKLKAVKGADKSASPPTSDLSPLASEQAGPNALEVYKRLQEEKFTVPQLATVCIKNEWIDPPAGYTGKLEELADVPLASFGEEKLGEIIESWDVVADQMAKLVKGDS